MAFGSIAGEVGNLYQMQGPVQSRDEAERARVTPDLLRQVLLKVSGDEVALQSVDLAPLLADSQRLVHQYQYVRTNIVSADLTQPDQLALLLTFDARLVNQALRELGLPIWGRVRPDVLIWTALEQQGQRELLGLENAPQALVQALTAAADRRGIPLLLPLMDLEDQTQLTFNEVWNGDNDAMQAASQRYGAGVVLSARISGDEGNTEIRWQALVDGETLRWQSSGTAATAIDDGIDELVSRLSRRYTQVIPDNAAEQRVQIQIDGVAGYADFSRVMDYLRQLDLITDIRVLDMSDAQLELDLSYTGSLQVLKRLLSVGQTLVELETVEAGGTGQYRLLP